MTTWIDVRAADEYATGHVSGAINIPHDVITQQISDLNLPADNDIRVYCRTGRRSGIAKELLEQMGYRQVKNEGGFDELMARKAAGETLP